MKGPMARAFCRFALPLAAAAWAAIAASAAWGAPEPKTHSKAPYVHNLTLYDEDGKAISPSDPDPKPYSPKRTCGKCHDYSRISMGTHFSPASSQPSGRQGQPWVVLGPSGQAKALSFAGQGATSRPAAAGLDNWRFVQTFGRHLPGGGPGEMGDTDPTSRARWAISGRMEIDCMICHTAGGSYDINERAVQLAEQNVRWMPTVAAGLGVVRGSAKVLPDDYDPELPMPGQEVKPPRVIYNRARFDANDRVLLDITRRVPNERCYQCHTTRDLGVREVQADTDVHLKAGMSCVDCHRHGLDHKMVRGFEGEPTSPPQRPALSCRGCHLGEAGATVAALRGGRLAAPVPRHAGLPAVHIDSLSCTACHVGPAPAAHPRRVQTSLAHGLGLASTTRDGSAPPIIQAGLMMRGGDGKIGPYLSLGTGQTRVSWSVGHDVLPASRALGAGGCGDCHDASAPFLWGEFEGRTPMVAAMGLDGEYHRLFAQSFVFRPMLKIVGFVASGVILLVLLAYGLAGLRAALRR
jgi:hypothetical protein